MDVTFDNITYTVSTGKRGKCLFFFLLSYVLIEDKSPWVRLVLMFTRHWCLCFFVIRFMPFVLVDFDRVFFLVLLTCFNVL